jgi:hypothetical protein
LVGALIFALLADNQGSRADDAEPATAPLGPVSKETIHRLREQAQPQPEMDIATAPRRGRTAGAGVVDPRSALANFACVVDGYGPVRPISRADLPTLAFASRAPGSRVLEIFYNPSWMNTFRQSTRLFWLEHECSHHRLRHTQSKTEKSLNCQAREEDAADCEAIVTMADPTRRTIDARGFQDVEYDVSLLPGGDGVHRKGTDRVQLLRSCLGDRKWAAQIMDARC